MWTELVPYIVASLVIVVTPGAVINVVAGFRLFNALLLAPAVSLGIIGSAAIFADRTGQGWGLLPVVEVMVLAIGVAALVRLIWQQVAPQRVLDSPASASHIGWVSLAAVISLVILGIDSVSIFTPANAFSQTYDNIFHLNAVRWVVDTGNASTLNMAMTSGQGASMIYPMAWHDLVSLTVIALNSTDVPTAANGVTFTIIAAIWPSGVLALVRRFLPHPPLALLAAGVLSGSFALFPYMPLSYGVLYPNLLGLCLLPAIVAVAGNIFGSGRGSRWSLSGSWVAAIIGTLGLALAHPNVALAALALFGTVLAGARAFMVLRYRRLRQRRRAIVLLRLATLLAWVGLAVVLYILLRPIPESAFWEPPRDLNQLLLETLLMSPLEAKVTPVVAFLVWFGWVLTWINPRDRWLGACHLVVTLLWGVAAVLPKGPLRYALVGPWYSDAFRLAAFLPVTGIPLACLATVWIVARLGRVITGHGRIAASLIPLRTAAVVTVSLMLAGSILPFSAKRAAVEQARWSFSVTDNGRLVDSDEYALIEQVPSLIPDDAVVAVNPYNGSSMLYALTGQPTTNTHVVYGATPTQETVYLSLNQAGIDPHVCEVFTANNIRYALDFGQEEIINDIDYHYSGWEDLAQAPGFEVIAQRGDASLYRITACE